MLLLAYDLSKIRILTVCGSVHYWFSLSQVRLGEPGYKERYYSEKFGVSKPEEINEIRKDVVSSLT